MSGLFEIVQYEVHVFEGGHWSVRTRCPRSEREHAFTEARRIDLNESLPARVVRDVYDPHNGRSQEFTIFISERAKALKAGGAPVPRARSAARPAATTAAERRHARPAPLAFRVTMAVGVGAVTALLISGITTWALTPEPESFASVLARSPAPGPAMTLFGAVMLFSVFTMLRGPLGISRLARTIGAHLHGPQRTRRSAMVLQGGARPPRRASADAGLDTAAAEHYAQLLSMSRIMLARFYVDAAPANAAQAMEDSLGVRGLALYLAGAAGELASHLELPSPSDLIANISPTLLRDSVQEILGELRLVGAADASLVAAGRTGMRAYLGAAEESPSMAGPLVAWHKAIRAELRAPGSP